MRVIRLLPRESSLGCKEKLTLTFPKKKAMDSVGYGPFFVLTTEEYFCVFAFATSQRTVSTEPSVKWLTLKDSAAFHLCKVLRRSQKHTL